MQTALATDASPAGAIAIHLPGSLGSRQANEISSPPVGRIRQLAKDEELFAVGR